MIRRRPAAGGQIPLCISYCRNFNTRPQNVSERMWRNIQNRLRFLVQFRFFPQRTPGNRGAFSTCYRRTISTKWVQNVVKTKKVSACVPSFSEILFENVDYLTRKCATWPRRFLYTESTNHPEHPCAPSGRHVRRAAATWDTHLIIVQEAIT